MLIRVEKAEDVEAAERVRRRDGDRSIAAMVRRLINESDCTGGHPDAVAELHRVASGGVRRAKRKGAKS